jgi:uncharacterized membrane protein
MKRALLSATLCAILLSAVALPASATATANFQGSSLAFSKNGDFDAQRGGGSTCSGGTISYSWTFDDGGTATGNPVTHHWASTSIGTATLTVTCSGGHGTATLLRAVCFSACLPGGIIPDAGYN